jgi:hypothetical protein
MRKWALLASIAALLRIAGAQAPPNFSGSWIDSQCNTYQFEQRGEKLRITSSGWKYDASAIHRVYEGDLALEGVLSAQGFEAHQYSIDVRMSGSLREKWIDAKISVGADTFDVPMCPRSSKLAAGCSTRGGGKPARLEIRSAGASNMPGGSVPAMVYLLDSQGRSTRAPNDIAVKLAGAAKEQSLVIAQNAPFIATFLEIPKTGPVEIRAEAAGLAPNTKPLFGCAPDAPRRLNVIVSEPRPKVGSTAPLLIALFGPVNSAETPLAPSWQPDSVGRLVDGNRLAVPAGRCAVEAALTSDEPGSSKLTIHAALADVPPATVTVLWRRTITPLLIGLAALGGLAGALLTKLFQAKRKWRVSDLWNLARGVLAAVVVYLMYFNLMLLARDPGGNVAAFAVGAAAGYAGKAALDRFARRTLGGGQPRAGQSFRAKTA